MMNPAGSVDIPGYEAVCRPEPQAKDLVVAGKPPDPSLHFVPLRTTTLFLMEKVNKATPARNCARSASRGFRAGALGFCVLCLLLPLGARGAAANPSPQDSATANAQTQYPSKAQTERREEVRQKNINNPESDDGVTQYRHSPMVQKLARMLGLSVETAARLFEILNFILLLAGVVWLIARVLPKALRARTERIRNEIEQARVATEQATRRLAAVEERLARLDAEIDAIRTQAMHETALEETRLRDSLEREKQLILAAATQDIAAASSNAQNQLKKLAANLVIEHAKRQIAITPKTDQMLIEGFLADLPKTHPRGGVN